MARRTRTALVVVLLGIVVLGVRTGLNDRPPVSSALGPPTAARTAPSDPDATSTAPAAPPPSAESHPAVWRPTAWAEWSTTVEARNLRGSLASGALPDFTDAPGVALSETGLVVTTGWYRYAMAWSDVVDVYCSDTMDADNPEVLCIQRADGNFIVLTDLALGDQTQAIALRAQQLLGDANGHPTEGTVTCGAPYRGPTVPPTGAVAYSAARSAALSTSSAAATFSSR